jgi:hypothetical protein
MAKQGAKPTFTPPAPFKPAFSAPAPLTPAQALELLVGEPVPMRFPKPVLLLIADPAARSVFTPKIHIQYEPGDWPVPSALAAHPYLAVNGVERVPETDPFEKRAEICLRLNRIFAGSRTARCATLDQGATEE